jgi:hypothetical protein
MRAGPLSDNRVISLLNRYFVPVYTSNQDSGPQGRGAPEETAEHVRIYREAMQAPCGAGAVFVFILNPAGQVMDGLGVSQASQGSTLAEKLEGVAHKLHTDPGPPVVKPAPQARPPHRDADSLVLHVTTRAGRKTFPWGAFPAENWIVLSRTESGNLIPAGEVKVGTSWTVEEALAGKLLRNFYPQMEETGTNDDRSRIEKASLRATVVSVSAPGVQVRLDGVLRMKRSFYARHDDDNYVEATLIGLLEFAAGSRRITDLELVTEKASYGAGNPEEFGAALSTLSQDTLHTLEPAPRP